MSRRRSRRRKSRIRDNSRSGMTWMKQKKSGILVRRLRESKIRHEDFRSSFVRV